HQLVLSLVAYLPCRIIGDPLQAIFDFADKSVCWEEQIYPNFVKLGELCTPWRWKNAGADELGEWLISIRADIEKNQSPMMPNPIPEGLEFIKVDIDDFTVSPNIRLKKFYQSAFSKGSSIIVFSGDQRSKNKAHNLAKSLGGRFTSIEEVEGKSLSTAIVKIDRAATSGKKIIELILLFKKCMTGIPNTLCASTKKGEMAKITKRTRHPKIAAMANDYIKEPCSETILRLITEFEDISDVNIYRRDLLNRLKGVLKLHIHGKAIDLKHALELYKQEFRHSGRPLKFSKQIGTTLLVKGLEYDHCIIVNPKKMTRKELYVALTRGAKSVCVIHP
ncbi:MAG: hypothetical protein HRT88_16805, partial [Lentisphaeraceae bacterium]|nr:hypothetical protein [Lentisphaeraceae bacterium]